MSSSIAVFASHATNANFRDFLLSDYCVSSHLASAVIRQIGDSQFADAAHDVVNFGAQELDSFVDVDSVVPFVTRNYNVIVDLMKDDAVDMGIKLHDAVPDQAAITNFAMGFFTNLAFYAAEAVSRWFVDFVNNEVLLAH